VIGARNWITPPDEIEEAFFPFPADMLDAIHTYLQPLEGYQLKRVNDAEALLARNKMGI
jgi:2-oxoisovalerate dehydrogenase E1 component